MDCPQVTLGTLTAVAGYIHGTGASHRGTSQAIVGQQARDLTGEAHDFSAAVRAAAANFRRSPTIQRVLGPALTGFGRRPFLTCRSTVISLKLLSAATTGKGTSALSGRSSKPHKIFWCAGLNPASILFVKAIAPLGHCPSGIAAFAATWG